MNLKCGLNVLSSSIGQIMLSRIIEMKITGEELLNLENGYKICHEKHFLVAEMAE